MENVKVEIISDDKEVLFSCVIHALTIALDTRRVELASEVLERDVSTSAKGVLLTCAAFAASFHDEEGNLMYPNEDAVDVINNSVSSPVYKQLVEAYSEVNPLEPSLTAKKKKF